MTELLPFTPVAKNDIEALEDLVLDNDLDRLEGLTAGFNIFESIGAVRREVRHSDFLSFLFDPMESHGLYDYFIKAILFGIVKHNRSIVSISAIDIDLLDLSNIEVRREWENIDILLLSDKEKFVCAIENKIDSSEHSNQLGRYESIINTTFVDYKKIFVYLTIDGSSPVQDQSWLPYSYQDIHDITASIIDESDGKIGQDIYTLLRHYTEMINRHFMSDNEIANLSKKLYQRHKKALDIIFEHKPDILTETNKRLTEYLDAYPHSDVELDHCSKSAVRFSFKHWDQINGQMTGDGQWTKSNRVILFEIVNSPNEITMKLIIGPGEKGFREDVFASAMDEKKLFKGISKLLYGKWTQIYKRKIVTKAQLDYDLETVEKLITQELDEFFYHGDSAKLCAFFDEKYGVKKPQEKSALES